MKNLVLGSLLLLCCTFLLSCKDSEKETGVAPASLEGQWKLEQIKDGSKTILPVTTDRIVWINFGVHPLIQTAGGEPDNLYGESLVNNYSGKVTYKGKGSAGSLSVSDISTNEAAGDAKHMEFDTLYLNLLGGATGYNVKTNNLQIQAKGKGRTEGREYTLVFNRMK